VADGRFGRTLALRTRLGRRVLVTIGLRKHTRVQDRKVDLGSRGHLKTTNILRWSGSKAKLVPELLRLQPPAFDRYVEPFAGSAQLFFALTPRQAILGDLNPHVMAVYRAIGQDPHGVADALESIPLTADGYYTLRAVEPMALPLVQRAARLIFLMKSCFNGVYRTNRFGAFNVPMGSRIYALPNRADLVEAQRVLAAVELVDGGFEHTLSKTRRHDWIYMDPPYLHPGRYRGEYGYSARFMPESLWSMLDHARALVKGGRQVMLSYPDDGRLVGELRGWSVHRVRTLRTVASAAGARKEINELVMTSYKS
jgi:DNA adenine methylase